MLDPAGHWLPAARCRPSPNQDPRPPGEAVALVVLHNISLPPGEFGTGCVEQFFLNRLDTGAHPFFRTIADLRVSAHLFIDREGLLTQFVPFHRRAWHAGRSRFRDRAACNDFSVGIELEGTDTQPYTTPQYDRLVAVIAALGGIFPALDGDRLVGHSDIAPGRKTDPGPAFDWRRLEAGLCSLDRRWARRRDRPD